MNDQTVNYLEYDDAQELVERIAQRTQNFSYVMSEPEKDAMTQLLSDIGVNTSDLINVNNLADNYAINAEIVNGDNEAEQYSRSALDDALFTWKENGEPCYCIQW